MLTAVSLKNRKELEKDAGRIEDRHDSGELSDASHKELMNIVDTARVRRLGQGRAARLRISRNPSLLQVTRLGTPP